MCIIFIETKFKQRLKIVFGMAVYDHKLMVINIYVKLEVVFIANVYSKNVN